MCQVINDQYYLVSVKPRNFRCDTCIQEAYFTLDNAKFWYLNFVYNFMYKCLDMSRIHFIEGDTDSAYWAVAGDPAEGIHQQFSAVISDRKFYDEHVYDWFPHPDGTIADPLEAMKDKKKLLGLCIEKEAEHCIALSPKCYTLFNGRIDLSKEQIEETKVFARKAKGVSMRKNEQITCEDYLRTVLSGEATLGRNVSFQVKDGEMKKVWIVKNALTVVHTKMVVLPNQSCHCFIYKG
jgi:hypothetical protein